ncbi:MAPEG family protein, partial [Gammaproteobacteria bacterium]|nr:MAPEG family protein [Gammaproteobacteria bacterium]
VLSGILIVLLGVSRIPSIIQNFGNLQSAKHSEDLRPKLPNWMRYITDNHNHLFEQPTLFYAMIIYIFLSEHVDLIHVQLAWGYVILRTVHSLVHTTTNNVSVRAPLFILSAICLVGMIVREIGFLINSVS